MIGLYKAEVIRRRGPWCSFEEVEFATLEWVWWFNYHRLFEPIGYVPPVEYEEAHYRAQGTPTKLPRLNPTRLRQTRSGSLGSLSFIPPAGSKCRCLACPHNPWRRCEHLSWCA